MSGSLKATKECDRSSSRGFYVEEHRGTSSRGLPGTVGSRCMWSMSSVKEALLELLPLMVTCHGSLETISMEVNCSSGVLASGLSWSAAISAFYLWEGSVEGKVNHELDGEEAGVEADLEPNQEVIVLVLADSGKVPPPPEFDLDGAQGEDGARADEDAEHT